MLERRQGTQGTPLVQEMTETALRWQGFAIGLLAGMFGLAGA